MVLINFKVDFEHLFGLPKQLFIDRELIAMGTVESIQGVSDCKVNTDTYM